MSEDEGGTAARIERGAGRFVRRSLVFLLSVLLIGAWIGSSGWYRLQPGEAASLRDLWPLPWLHILQCGFYGCYMWRCCAAAAANDVQEAIIGKPS